MVLKADQCIFKIDVLLKTSQPGKHLSKVVIAAYPDNKNLCPVQHLKSYLEKTSTLRGKHTQLFVSFQKPHNPVSTDTIARWIKTVMSKAGINTEIYEISIYQIAATVIFKIDVLLKTSQPGKHLSKVVIAAYPDNKNLCPVQHLKSYLEKTSTLRGKHTQLFVSFQKPHNPVSTDTIARWIKTVMSKAGINTEIYEISIYLKFSAALFSILVVVVAALFVFGGLHFYLVLGLTRAFLAFLYFL